MKESAAITPDIHFRRITATSLGQICDLSKTLSPIQRCMVTDNFHSIAKADYFASAWMRSIHADHTSIGFIMIHTGSDYEDGIDCPNVFLWRLMIAAPYQGKGFGKRTIDRFFQNPKTMWSLSCTPPAGRGTAALSLSSAAWFHANQRPLRRRG